MHLLFSKKIHLLYFILLLINYYNYYYYHNIIQFNHYSIFFSFINLLVK